jgi:hypothetical protein
LKDFRLAIAVNSAAKSLPHGGEVAQSIGQYITVGIEQYHLTRIAKRPQGDEIA